MAAVVEVDAVIVVAVAHFQLEVAQTHPQTGKVAEGRRQHEAKLGVVGRQSDWYRSEVQPDPLSQLQSPAVSAYDPARPVEGQVNASCRVKPAGLTHSPKDGSEMLSVSLVEASA